MSHEIPILYQDADVVVVHKPSGLAVHRGWAKEDAYAMTLVRDQIGQFVFPVHRLDRATSGLLIFALSPEMAAQLQASLGSVRTKKIYVAMTRGHTPESGCIDHPLRKSPTHEARPSHTDYRRIATLERYSFVLASPRQGRLHQIRRHFKHISHHLIGDVRYGKGEHNRYARDQFALHRLALHACQLSIPDPRSPATQLTWIAPLPADLQSLIERSLTPQQFGASLQEFSNELTNIRPTT